MIKVAHDVAQFYYENRDPHGRNEWRLSVETCMSIARLVPNYDGMSDEVLEEFVRRESMTLFGEPIILDDSVEGLMLVAR